MLSPVIFQTLRQGPEPDVDQAAVQGAVELAEVLAFEHYWKVFTDSMTKFHNFKFRFAN